MKSIKNACLIIFVVSVLSSCVSNRKIITMKKALDEKKADEKKFENKITYLDKFRENKNSMGELDDKSSSSLQVILDKEKLESTRRNDTLNKFTNMLNGNKRVKLKDFKNIVTVITVTNDVVSQKAESLNFVEQLLKQQTFIKFNTAAFFQAGGYKIPEEKMAEAKMVFSPIVDSLIVFVKKFPKYKLNSSIIASGYADSQGFGAGALVDELTKNIGKEVATKQELNSELSRLRAEEVSTILVEIYNEKIKEFQNIYQFKTQFYKIGKGEDFPNKKIENYQVDDERRRIVVIYWNAFPE